jgi:phospholipid N-methyltransferase
MLLHQEALMPETVGFLRERQIMWKAFRKDFFHTGSLMPSSKALARELASSLKGSRSPARILEIGAGTGPVTAQILPLLIPGDQLDIVEINHDFVQLLCHRFRIETPAALDSPPAPVRILHAPVQDIPGQGLYQHLISGLPFNNFPIKLVRSIWQTIHRLAAPGAHFAFFEYVAIRKMKMPFVTRSERKRLQLVGRHLHQNIKRFEQRNRKVFLNVPPAIVHHLVLHK